MNQPWRAAGLVVARVALSAWVGAAALFVIDGVRLITSPVFDSTARDRIALLRFPPYYATGAALLSVALAGALLARGQAGLSGRRGTVVLILTFCAGAVMAGDYLWIYTPLAEMITPPGSVRPESFHAYHLASRYINLVQVALSLAAACVCNWPLGCSDRRASAPRAP